MFYTPVCHESHFSHLNLNKRATGIRLLHNHTLNKRLSPDHTHSHSHSQSDILLQLTVYSHLTQPAKHLQFQECFNCISIIKAPGINTHHVIFVSFSTVSFFCFLHPTFPKRADYTRVYHQEAPHNGSYFHLTNQSMQLFIIHVYSVTMWLYLTLWTPERLYYLSFKRFVSEHRE